MPTFSPDIAPPFNPDILAAIRETHRKIRADLETLYRLACEGSDRAHEHGQIVYGQLEDVADWYPVWGEFVADCPTEARILACLDRGPDACTVRKTIEQIFA